MIRLCLLLMLTLAPMTSSLATEPSSVLDLVLSKAEKHAAAFLDIFSEVKCTEHVDQRKLSPKGKVEFSAQSTYDYLLLAQTADGEMSLEESRIEEQAADRKNSVPMLVTNGFATLLLVFHPYYESAYQFFDQGEAIVAGRRVAKIGFRHIRGQKTPTVLMLRGREYPLEMMGTAWIDEEDGAIVRIESELQSDMADIGLKTLRSDVTYAPVKFRGMDVAPWLPAEASIEVETARQHWRNTHRFEDYQHFGVETEHKDDPNNTLSKSK